MGDTFGDGSLMKDRFMKSVLTTFMWANTKITQGQWKAIMGNNPSRYKDWGDNCPREGKLE